MSDNSKSRAARRNIVRALIAAGVQIGGSLLFTLARMRGLIDAETATRGVMVLIGLGFAAYGNFIPKALDGQAPLSIRAAAVRQSIYRVGGWAVTLAGLVYAALWAFAPHDVANTGGMIAVGASMIVMFGYGAWRVISCSRSPAA